MAANSMLKMNLATSTMVTLTRTLPSKRLATLMEVSMEVTPMLMLLVSSNMSTMLLMELVSVLKTPVSLLPLCMMELLPPSAQSPLLLLWTLPRLLRLRLLLLLPLLPKRLLLLPLLREREGRLSLHLPMDLELTTQLLLTTHTLATLAMAMLDSTMGYMDYLIMDRHIPYRMISICYEHIRCNKDIHLLK